MKEPFLLIIDGSSLLSTHYYGNLPRQILFAKTKEEKEKYYHKIMMTRTGVYTNAVYGFLRALLKIIHENEPSHIAVCWDLTRDTFRRERFPEYKGNRDETPKPLSSQFELMQEILKRIGVPEFSDLRFEADDFAGTIAERFSSEIPVRILTKDRDYLQLVTDRVHVWMLQSTEEKAKEAYERYHLTREERNAPEKTLDLDPELVRAEYEIAPESVTSLKGLEGDPSDNIPGVPGVGHQTAVRLISEYQTVESLYEALHSSLPDGEEKLKAHWKNDLGITRPPIAALLKDDPDLLCGERAARLSKELATISKEAPVGDLKLQDLALSINAEELARVLDELEMKSLAALLSVPSASKDFFPVAQVTEDYGEAEAFVKKAAESAVIGVSYLEGNGLALACGTESVFFIREIFLLNRDSFRAFLTSLKTKGATLVSFEGKELYRTFGIASEDLPIAAYLLDPLSGDLSPEKIVADRLHVTIDPDVSAEKRASYLAYAAMRCHPVLINALRDAGMLSLYREIELPTMEALVDMETAGIRVNKEALDEFSAFLKAKIDTLSAEIYKEAGMTFNINSPKQLAEVLFEKLAIPYGKKPKSGYSTSADVLERFRADHPIVGRVLEYRTYAKLRSTYAEALPGYIQKDGRIHGTFHQTVTATGRISSSDPNLQNIPVRTELGQEFRKAFVPEDGSVLIDADYSQIELRVLASIAEDENLIRAFLHHEDIHTLTASQVFHVALDQVTPELRRKAKAVNFGIVYGISAYSLSEDLSVTVAEAESYMASYFDSYPGVRAYLDRTIEEAEKTGKVRTMFGRIRPIPELQSGNYNQRQFGIRVAMNSPIQGTAADIMKIAVIRVRQALKDAGLRSRIVLQVHDEIILEAPEKEAEEAKTILVREMEHAASLKTELLAEAKTGYSWYEAK